MLRKNALDLLGHGLLHLLHTAGHQRYIRLAADNSHIPPHQRTVDLALNRTIQIQVSLLLFGMHRPIRLKGRRRNNLVAKDQNLRQHKEHENNRNNRSSRQRLAQTDDRRIGRKHTDRRPRQHHDRTGGNNRRKGKIQRLYYRFFPVFFLSGFDISRRDHDSVIDVRAHLDRTDDQITQEINIPPQHGGQCEIDENSALDHQNLHQRQPDRTKRKKQHHQHEQHRYDTDDDIVHVKCLF